MSDNNRSSSGTGLSGVVFLIFLTLKLLEIDPVASWSWWWVTSPLWIGLVLFVGFLAFGGAAVGVTAILGKLFAGRKVKLDDD